jgi:hypothetical protein
MKLLFHYPGPLHEQLDSGEKKRPVMMQRAFAELGYEVLPLVGDRAERRRRWPALERALADCRLVYSENSTLPLGLTGRHHLPTWSPVDYQLFRTAHRRGVPTGVFYRDVYWRFPSFRQEVGWLKPLLARPFYHQELRLYAATCTAVFVPSEPFKAYLPAALRPRLHVLPPGGELPPLAERRPGGPLQLIYVGAVKPPIYDIAPLLAALTDLVDQPVKLTICTRPAEYAVWRDHYAWPANVEVVHLSGAPLQQLLQTADVSLMCFAPDPYRDLAMPLKLFEAISHGLPVIATGPTAVSQFLVQEGAGWEIAPTELTGLLRRLLADPAAVQRMQQRVRAMREQHTWLARARTAAAILLGQAG